MLIRLFQFCNPFLSHIVNAGLGPPSVSVSLCFDFNKFSTSPHVLCTEEAEEVCRPASPAIVYQRAAEVLVFPCGHVGLFCTDLLEGLGMKQRHLDPTVFAHCSCCQSLTKFVIYHVNHFHACFVLTDSSISSRLEHCRVGTFGKAVLLLSGFQGHF